MAAFLKLDLLRVHAVPDLPPTVRDHALARPLQTPPIGLPTSCPMLTAHWLVGPDGRLSYRWQTGATALRPPPH